MAHNVKVKFYARENVKLKPHSFYAQPLPNGTYGFEQICEEAAENTTIETGTIRQAVELYMKVVRKKLCDGFRAEIGKQFVTLGPGLTAKVKDELNDDGTVKKACTADDLTAVGGKSRVTATVNPEFVYEFAKHVKWQKSDKQGNVIEDEDATLDGDSEENANANQGGSEQNQNQNGGGDDNGGGGDLNPGENDG